MKLTCPECKNEVDLSIYPNLAKGDVVECDKCGITLMVTNIDGDEVAVEIVDEGK
jgi:lysine biosynthesis protein LysW